MSSTRKNPKSNVFHRGQNVLRPRTIYFGEDMAWGSLTHYENEKKKFPVKGRHRFALEGTRNGWDLNDAIEAFMKMMRKPRTLLCPLDTTPGWAHRLLGGRFFEGPNRSNGHLKKNNWREILSFSLRPKILTGRKRLKIVQF